MHRCGCDAPDSDLHAFFARAAPIPADDYYPSTMTTPYVRGVPPQVKRKRRYQLRKHYADYYARLCAAYGEKCANCGVTPDEDTTLAIDHIMSIAKGGTSDYDNLQLLCAECNRIKGKLCIDCRVTPENIDSDEK